MSNSIVIIDTETTMSETVADFSLSVVTRGKVKFTFSAMVEGHFLVADLFYLAKDDGSPFSKKSLARRTNIYKRMVRSGERVLASPEAINKVLEFVAREYKPKAVTCFNYKFDLVKCSNTGIDFGLLNCPSFCLMKSSHNLICNKKAYRTFALDNHCFGNKTLKSGAITMKRTAESVANFCLAQTGKDFAIEKHTAESDVLDFEYPIYQYLAKRFSLEKIMWNGHSAPNYLSVQLRDLYKAK